MRRSLKEALIPSCITLMIFMGVLALKGIFPFGELRIDYYDMGQTNAPLYYHIWDFLHGKSGLLYSWYIDEGQNLSMGSSIQWNISVFNLFFLFIKRSAVLKSLSIFMGIHLFFMTFNMFLFLSRTVDTAKFYRMLFSISYGLTGFTLTHYTIPTYLDTAALMPIWLITLHDLLTAGDKTEGRPVTTYAFMTGYMTALGYYMAFMNLIFILMVSGSYIILLCGRDLAENTYRKKEMGRASVRLGIGTFSGIGLSAFILLPAVMQMAESSRFNSNLSGGFLDTLHGILWAIGADMYYIKWWLLSGSIAAIIILLWGLIRYRKEKNLTLFFFLLCMYPCALIPFESINLLWHMGTYYHYPIRCGYLIPIALLTTGAYYSGRTETDREVDINRTGMVLVSAAAFLAAVMLIYYYTKHDVWPIEELFKAWVVLALVLAVVYSLIWYVVKKPAYIFPVLMMELLVTGYIGYGQPHFTDRYSSDPEQSGEYIVVSQALMDELGIKESRIERIKNPDTTLNTNYGFVMRRATIGGWANTVPRPQMDTGIALGYGAHFMRILDCGGTLLSDAALHVTETLTANPELYTDQAFIPEGEAGGYTLFRNKYTLPFVMRVAEKPIADRIDGDRLAQMSLVDATNTLYRLLSEGKSIHSDDDTIIEDISDRIGEGKYHIEGLKALYLQFGEFEGMKINDKVIAIPDISDADSTVYPGWFNSNLVFLGIYGNEDIEIEGRDLNSHFYEFDLDKLEKICDFMADDSIQDIEVQNTKMRIVTKGKKDEIALIPMAYDAGFTASVNGEQKDVMNVDDMFMAIRLDEGENVIQISFVPRGFRAGVVISLVLLVGIVLFSFRPVSTNKAYDVGRIALTALFAVFVLILYLIPYIAFAIHQIEKRL